MNNNKDNFIIRRTVAFYLAIAPKTLGNWVNFLKPIKRGRAVYYSRPEVEKFIGNRELVPLLTRKAAAKRLRVAPRTLKSKKYNERRDLHPITLGTRAVRYHPADIDRCLDDCMRPHKRGNETTLH